MVREFDEPSRSLAPKPFLRKGAGTSKYKLSYPILKKSGLQQQQQSLQTTDAGRVPSAPLEMHYASSPVRYFTQSSSTDQPLQNRPRLPSVPRLNFDEEDVRPRTDSGRGQDSHSDRERNDGYLCRTPGIGSPEYIPASGRTIETGDSGCDDMSAGILSPEGTHADADAGGTIVSRLDESHEMVLPTAQVPRVFDVSGGRRVAPFALSDTDHQVTIQSRMDDTIPEGGHGSNRGQRHRDSQSVASQSLISFENHETSIRNKSKKNVPPSSSDSVSNASIFSEATKQVRAVAKNAAHHVHNLRSFTPSTHSGSMSESEAQSQPGQQFIHGNIPSQAHTSFGVSPISSIHPQSSHPSTDNSSESSQFAIRHLGARRAFDDVVPPLFGPTNPSLAPLNPRASEVTSLPNRQPFDHRVAFRDAAHQIDLSTPQNQPQRIQRGRVRNGSEDGIVERRVLQLRNDEYSRDKKKDAVGGVQTRVDPMEQNLILQLRDTIVNFDFAESEWRKKKREFVDRLESERSELAMEREEWTEKKKLEDERMQREWKSIEREKRGLRRGDAEREKELIEQLDDQRKLINKMQQQLADARTKESRREKMEETQRKEMERVQTVKERLERRVAKLEKDAAVLRGKAATEKAQIDAEKRANERRNQRPGLLRAENRHPLPPSGATEKSVKWADGIEEEKRKEKTVEQNPDERIFSSFDGVYKSARGDWTKHSQTPCGCSFFEYNNGDIRWIERNSRVQIYYYAAPGSTVIELADGTVIRHFNSRQFEIFRPNREITMISPNGKRVETVLKPDGTFYVEIFEASEWREPGTILSQRMGGGYCRISNDNAIDIADNGWSVWYREGACKISIDSMGIQISLLADQDEGVVKHVNVVELGGQKNKSVCVNWGSAVRRANRSLIDGNTSMRNTVLGSIGNISLL